jgi:hypothetical protein
MLDIFHRDEVLPEGRTNEVEVRLRAGALRRRRAWQAELAGKESDALSWSD